MKLNEFDFKLLSYLYHGGRESISKIAKETKLSREQVSYKLENYLSSGLIKRFMTVFDWSKFGYDYYVVVLLRVSSYSKEAAFLNLLKASKNCISFGKAFGKYDLFVNMIFRDEKEFTEWIVENLGENGEISEYIFLRPHFAELYPLKFANSRQRDEITIIGRDDKAGKLDKKDLQMLKILEKDGRAKLKDTASELGISSELALYKLRQLKEKKIVIGSRIEFSMRKLGYFFTVILIKSKSISEKEKTRLKQFAKDSRHVNSLMFFLSGYQCAVQIFHKDELEVRNSIGEMRKILDKPVEIDLLLLEEDEKMNTLPFI